MTQTYRRRIVVLSFFLMFSLLLSMDSALAYAQILPGDIIPIGEIQGDGWSTPYYGVEVQTTGIVTANYRSYPATKRGFFVQDPVGDGNPDTSDGIFVYDRYEPVEDQHPPSGRNKPKSVARGVTDHLGYG